MLNEKLIGALEKRGFKRWQKGDMDRLYIDPEKIGFEFSYNSRGKLYRADREDSSYSERVAFVIKNSKTYIDVITGELVSNCIYVEQAAQDVYNDVIAQVENESKEADEAAANVITPDRVNEAFSGYLYGAPVNADAIAPALNEIFISLLHSDPTPVHYDMSLSRTLAYYELFPKYLAGSYENVPAPVFDVAMVYNDDSVLQKIGTTLTGREIDSLSHIVSLDEAIEIYKRDRQYCNDFKIAHFSLTFYNARRMETYTLTRFENYATDLIDGGDIDD